MNKKPLTILTSFGTRPEVIKLFPILEKLELESSFKSIVVSTSQHREMIDDLLSLFHIKPDHDLNIIQKDQSLSDISTRALSGLEQLLKNNEPDMILVQGDTTSAFIAALAAFYNKIPVGHVEAGLRSFNKMHPYPEEINRRLISSLCDLHFSPTKGNADNLINEGVDRKKIFVTGNTVIDSLQYISKNSQNTLRKYLRDEEISSNRIVLVTAHRRENWGKPLENLCYAIVELCKIFDDICIVYPVHLNPNVRKTVFSMLDNRERIHLMDPLPYETFVELMRKASVIVTDSGGIQEEGPTFQKPILVFRKVTERPEGLSAAGVKLLELTQESVVRETSSILRDGNRDLKASPPNNPYGDGYASQRIIDAIMHYFNRGERPLDYSEMENIGGGRVVHPAKSTIRPLPDVTFESIRTHVLLPAYNEEKSLSYLLERFADLNNQQEITVWVVDDGSTDETGAVARKGVDGLSVNLVSHERNYGLGQAVQTGFYSVLDVAGDNDVIIVMDADDTHDVSLINVMLEKIVEGADIVIASRFIKGGDDATAPVYRRLLSRGAAIVFNTLLPLNGIKDFTSGFRAYKVKLLRRVSNHWGERLIEERGFACMVELLLKLRYCGPVIKEVPLVLRYDRKMSASKLKIFKTIVQYMKLGIRDRLSLPPVRRI